MWSLHIQRAVSSVLHPRPCKQCARSLKWGAGTFLRGKEKIRCERICSKVCCEKNKIKSLPDVRGLGSKTRIKTLDACSAACFPTDIFTQPFACPGTAFSVTKNHWMFCLYPWQVADTSVTKCKKLWLKVESFPPLQRAHADTWFTWIRSRRPRGSNLKGRGPKMGHCVISCSLQ